MDIIATDKQGSTGSITYWSLSGAVNYGKLEAEWVNRGLNPQLLPPRTSPKTALRRAMDGLVSGQSQMVKVGSAPGWLGFFQRETVNGRPSFPMVVEACLNADPTKDPVIRTPDGSPVPEAIEDSVTILYSNELRNVHHDDLGTWLVSTVRRLMAVRMREAGGIYFIPAAGGLGEWQQIASVLHAATACTIQEVPAMHSREAARAVLEGITNEVNAYVEQIDAELGRVGVRALESREAAITAYARKISMFEEVIGAKLDGLRGAMSGLETKVAHAKLTAMSIAEDAA